MVEYFVSEDFQGRENPPNYSHETKAVIPMIRQVFAAFHHCSKLYALIANVEHKGAKADLVVLSESGIGIVELKHYYGKIHDEGALWKAGPERIKAGKYDNPHKQVQAYTATIRDELIGVKRYNDPWLSGTYSDWSEFKWNTVVCFTNPKAQLDPFRDDYAQKIYRQKLIKPWEHFDILQPEDFPEWVAQLRFERQNIKQGYASFRLTPRQIKNIIKYFEVTPWTEINNLMPTHKPYAYALLREDKERWLSFALMVDKLKIGRKPENEIVIPEQFEQASRDHAIIRRSLGRIYLKDVSSNGTFVDGKRLVKDKETVLEIGKNPQVTLGGPEPGDKVCLLTFSFEPPDVPGTLIPQTAGSQERATSTVQDL